MTSTQHKTVLEAALGDLTAMLTAGKISAPIRARVPRDEVARAHELVDSKSTVGNVVRLTGPAVEDENAE